MKKLTLVAVFCSFCLCLSACSLFYSYKSEAVGEFGVGYSKLFDDAFLGEAVWNGASNTVELVTPNEYEGIPITALGGYVGSGAPCPFGFVPSEQALKKLCDGNGEWTRLALDDVSAFADKITSVKTFELRLHVGKNIERIELINLDDCLVYELAEAETEKFEVFVLLLNVTCDEDNKVFYSEGGKLYYRSGGALVEGIAYSDTDLNGLTPG